MPVVHNLQAYGMMGWRVGYLAYPDAQSAADPNLEDQLIKVQDTVPICPTQMSMHVALGALKHGRQWVVDRVQGLEGNR